MTRLRTIAAILVAALIAVAIGLTACGGDDSAGGYKVRAMFFNAFTVIPGEDVKAAGVPIGTIASIDVEDRKAAVVLDITDPAFQDFRKDATCQIRPQSLIGERYVECELTKKKAPGQPESPKLDTIEDGPGKGQLLLPTTNTVNPIDLDLVNNTLRLPYRQRLTIILNELGVGLAGNGDALREAVQAANPSLRATEQLLEIFAEQNRTLAQIADDGDRALAPITAQRARVAGAIEAMNTTAQATAERTGPLEEGLEKLPASLREIRPTMAALNDMAAQLQPVADDLNSAGKDISRTIIGLGDIAEEAPAALKDLADTLDLGSEALLASEPILRDGKAFAADAKPLSKNLDALLGSLRTTGGFERLADFLYYTAAASNGYDEDGHYLRAHAIIGVCLDYQGTVCSENTRFKEGLASASSAQRRGPAAQAAKTDRKNRPLSMPSALLPGAQVAPQGRSRPVSDPKNVPADGKAAVLDYLMGD